MEKAIIGYGEYMLRPQYSFLAIPEEKWFRMSQDQHLRWIQKFNACAVRSRTEEGPSMSTSTDPQVAILSGTSAASDPSRQVLFIKELSGEGAIKQLPEGGGSIKQFP